MDEKKKNTIAAYLPESLKEEFEMLWRGWLELSEGCVNGFKDNVRLEEELVKLQTENEILTHELEEGKEHIKELSTSFSAVVEWTERLLRALVPGITESGLRNDVTVTIEKLVEVRTALSFGSSNWVTGGIDVEA